LLIHEKRQQSISEIFEEETKDLDVRFFSNEIDITELPSAYKNAATVRNQMDEFSKCYLNIYNVKIKAKK
jgi:hypothetical protein